MIILIDTYEQHPWTFEGIRGDAAVGGRVIHVGTARRTLGPGWGDYSVDGFEGRCHIERKSVEDAHSTFLGWGERRERFERELERLSSIECGMVVVECEFSHLLATVQSYGKRTVEQNRKSLARICFSWSRRYSVRWWWCEGRRAAEITAYRILEGFYRDQMRAGKEAERAAVQMARDAAEAAQMTLLEL